MKEFKEEHHFSGVQEETNDVQNSRGQPRQQQKQEQQHQVTAFQDLLAGGVAGSCSVIVGHPFDTYKVMLQTSTSTAQPTKYSFSRLYRGLGAPLSSAAFVNALIFSSYGESSRLWENYFYLGDDKKNAALNENVKSTSPIKALVCGGFTGAVQTTIICPTEHVKCRLQTQKTGGGATTYKGSFDAMDKILLSHGIRGLFRGFVCTGLREIPAFGLYFVTYDHIKKSVSKLLPSTNIGNMSEESGTSSMQMWSASALAGGLSGALTWVAVYPFDVIKTRIQTKPLDTPLEKRRISYVYGKIVQQHGRRFLFRGLGVTLMRAFPVNAIIFPVYEFTLEHLAGSTISA